MGIPGGVEVLPHILRDWREIHADDPTRACIDFDESNAHNMVDRHSFFLRTREVLPGLSRWMEYIYPTNAATYVFFQGTAIESRAGGQQGCPLMMPIFCATKREMRDRVEGVADLDFVADFADDGVDGGDPRAVLNALHEEMRIARRFGLKLNFDKMRVYLVAGDGFRDTCGGPQSRLRESCLPFP